MDKASIVFFDGFCNLCNYTVNFIVKASKPELIQVAPLQGKTAKEKLKGNEFPDSILYLSGEKILTKSDAVIAICQQLGGFYKILAHLLRLFPRKLRDRLYDFVAKNRYRWFGKKSTCRTPTLEEQRFFLP